MSVWVDIDAVTVALRSWLEARMVAGTNQIPVYDTAPPPDAAPPFAVLHPLGGQLSVPRVFAPSAAVEQRFQLTAVADQHPSRARRVAGLARRALTGTDRSGTYVEPMTLPGVAVLARSSDGDGAPDRAGQLHQWSETFTLTVAAQ